MWYENKKIHYTLYVLNQEGDRISIIGFNPQGEIKRFLIDQHDLSFFKKVIQNYVPDLNKDFIRKIFVNGFSEE